MKRPSNAKALRMAAEVVSKPVPDGSQWVVYGPYSLRNWAGDRTWNYHNTYREAVSYRATWIAMIAAQILDLGFSAEEFSDMETKTGRAREQLDQAILRRARKYLAAMSTPMS